MLSRRSKLYSPFRGESHRLQIARETELLQMTRRRTEQSVVVQLEGRLEFLRTNDDAMRQLELDVETYRVAKNSASSRPELKSKKHRQTPAVPEKLADWVEDGYPDGEPFFMTEPLPNPAMSLKHQEGWIHENNANALAAGACGGRQVEGARARESVEKTDDRVARVQHRKRLVDAQWMRRHVEICERVEHMEEIRRAAEHRRRFQRLWVNVCTLTSRIPIFSNRMYVERQQKRIERATRIIQRYWRGYTVFRETLLKERALVVIRKFVLRVVAKRRRVVIRQSAMLIRRYLEDIREANRILFVVKRFRHAVITLQQQWRRYVLSKRARYALMLAQFQRCVVHLCNRLTRQIKTCPIHEQLTAIVKRDKVQHIAPDIIKRLLERNCRDRQLVYVSQWKMYKEQLKEHKSRMAFEQARLMMHQQASPSAVLFPAASTATQIMLASAESHAEPLGIRKMSKKELAQAEAEKKAIADKVARSVGPPPKKPHFATVLPPSQMMALVNTALQEQRERMKMRLIERGETIENILLQEKNSKSVDRGLESTTDRRGAAASNGQVSEKKNPPPIVSNRSNGSSHNSGNTARDTQKTTNPQKTSKS